MFDKECWLKIGKASEFLGVDKDNLRYWTNTGKINAIKHPVSGYRLYHENTLKRFKRRMEDQLKEQQND